MFCIFFLSNYLYLLKNVINDQILHQIFCWQTSWIQFGTTEVYESIREQTRIGLPIFLKGTAIESQFFEPPWQKQNYRFKLKIVKLKLFKVNHNV